MHCAERVGRGVVDVDRPKFTWRECPGVRVLNHLEFGDRLDRSGIGTAASQQRRALSRHADNVEVRTSPWVDGSIVESVKTGLRGGTFLPAFDVLHCNLPGPASLGLALVARKQGIPVVFHAHVTSEDFAGSFRGSTTVAPLLRRYLRRVYSVADLVLCPSDYTKRRLEAYPIDAPIRTVTNGVDIESLSGHESLRPTYRDRFDLSGFTVFTVGNVFARKGVADFCRIARTLAAESAPSTAPGATNEYEFVWFGPVDTGLSASTTVRRWVTASPSHVTFTGWIDDKRGAFGAGDVYLFPTHEENQGIAALEAMACGKPVVMRDLPVFREYYEDGHDCLLCGDRAEMTAAIRRLAASPALRERLAENARATARRHDLSTLGHELTDSYRWVLDRNASD